MLITIDEANLHNLWHEELRHLSYARMAKLPDLATRLKFSASVFSKKTSRLWIKSHSQRNINRKERTCATEFIAIFDSDLDEPFLLTIYGEEYYSLFKDDDNGVCWVYLMKTKNEVLAKFLIFYSCAENESACKLKVFWADWGRECLSTQFQEKRKKT